MIFYITTHEGNIKYANQIQEMFKDSGLEYYFVYGKTPQNYLEPKLILDVEESYENLPLKTYYITEHFLSTSHSYMVKMDDDTYIDFEKLKQQNFTEDYIGMFLTYPDDERSKIFHWYTVKTPEYLVKKPTFNLNYAEGGCYILSRKAAQAVYNHGYDFFDSTPATYLGEDVKVGMCLESEEYTKIDLMDNEGMYYEIAKDFLFIHPVNFILFNKLKNTSNDEKRAILNKYNFLNLNVRRDIFLNKKLKELNETK